MNTHGIRLFHRLVSRHGRSRTLRIRVWFSCGLLVEWCDDAGYGFGWLRVFLAEYAHDGSGHAIGVLPDVIPCKVGRDVDDKFPAVSAHSEGLIGSVYKEPSWRQVSSGQFASFSFCQIRTARAEGKATVAFQCGRHGSLTDWL